MNKNRMVRMIFRTQGHENIPGIKKRTPYSFTMKKENRWWTASHIGWSLLLRSKEKNRQKKSCLRQSNVGTSDTDFSRKIPWRVYPDKNCKTGGKQKDEIMATCRNSQALYPPCPEKIAEKRKTATNVLKPFVTNLSHYEKTGWFP